MPLPCRRLAWGALLLCASAAAEAGDAGEVAYVDSKAAEAALRERAAPAGAPRPGWEVFSYGTSAGGKPLVALRVGEKGLPTVLVHGGLGSRDAAGTAACLDLARRIASAEDPAVAAVAWLLIPAPNPDALDAFLAGAPRAGGGSVDRDRDGRLGEDGPSDLDGDGEVLRMRRRSPRGSFTIDDTPPKDGKAMGDPRLLVDKGVDARREASFETFDEGVDDDGDGDVNEDPPGLDLTRQMSGWTETKGPWGGDGPFPGFAPEAKALMDLSLAATSLVGWYGFSGEGPWILRASESGKVADDDDALYAKVAETLKAKASLDVKKASEAGAAGNPGSDLDWAAGHLGVLAFRVPVWRIAKEEGSGRAREVPDELDWLLWNDRVLGGAGFVPYKSYEHPTLGAVEIGGWKRFTRHEPPADLLPAAVASVSGVPLLHASFRPVLEVDLETKSLGEGAWRVVVRARNRGDGPTDLPSAEKRHRAMGVRASFAPSAGTEVLAGPDVANLGVVGAGATSGEAVWLVRRKDPGALGTATLRHRAAGVVVREAAP